MALFVEVIAHALVFCVIAGACACACICMRMCLRDHLIGNMLTCAFACECAWCAFACNCAERRNVIEYVVNNNSIHVVPCCSELDHELSGSVLYHCAVTCCAVCLRCTVLYHCAVQCGMVFLR